ncbi:glycosyl hydrolase family 28-related protein [Tsuneonella sp. HG249]
MKDNPVLKVRSVSRRIALQGIGVAAAAAAGESVAQPSATPQPRPRSGGNGQASVLDFGADPLGRNDSSAAFRRAMRELAGGHLSIPPGRFLVERIGGLGPAGQKIVGSSRWNTVLLSEAGGGPIFANESSSNGTSAFHLLSDFLVDLNDNDIVAIDLASVNCATIQRVHFKGGGPQSRRGTGVRFAAPLRRGAYDNAVHDCSFEYLRHGIRWDSGSNNNAVYNCRISNCEIGLHADPPGSVDTPRVFGGRVESCAIGLAEGANCGAYFSVRFEGNSLADIRFSERSVNAGVWGGLTASTRPSIVGFENASSPSIESSDLGFLAIEESSARPKISTGRHVFAKAGKAPDVLPQRDFSAQFSDYVLFENDAGIEFSNASANGSILGMAATPNDILSIPAYNRFTRRYATIELGGGAAVRPVTDGATDLGTSSNRYRALHLSGGVHIRGRQVVSEQQPAIADDGSGTPTAARLNQILAALRRHGLIES